MKLHKLLIGDRRMETDQTTTVINPYNGKPVARVSMAGVKELNAAIRAAQNAYKTTRRMSSLATVGLLKRAVHGLIKHRQKLVDTIVAEAGKPLALAEQEVARSITTFNIASEEASRMGGEFLPALRAPTSREDRGGGEYQGTYQPENGMKRSRLRSQA